MDALSRIGEKWLPPEETDAILRTTPLLEGDQTVAEVFNETEEDKGPRAGSQVDIVKRQKEIHL